MNTRKLLSGLILTAALVAAAPLAFAATTVKIGFVNVQEIMAKAPQAAVASAQLKQEFGAREQALTAERDAIQQQETDLKRNAAVMTAEKKTEAETALRDKVGKFNRDMANFRDQFSMKRNELLQGLQKQIYDAVVKVAKDGGYDLILSNGVAYASSRVDLTQQVLDELAKSKK